MYFRRLRDLREDRDLKQTDVAALLGIRQTVYSRYERGYQNLPLAAVLGYGIKGIRSRVALTQLVANG